MKDEGASTLFNLDLLNIGILRETETGHFICYEDRTSAFATDNSA